ncbi:hypothetical protein C8R47DRAFT_1091542 [Mycena vitilis]|nr:hypothetical protein C8R47DRAFT_1091542 [Mycena vitilis]
MAKWVSIISAATLALTELLGDTGTISVVSRLLTIPLDYMHSAWDSGHLTLGSMLGPTSSLPFLVLHYLFLLFTIFSHNHRAKNDPAGHRA